MELETLIVAALELFVLLITAFVAFLTYRKQKRTSKNRFISDLYSKLIDDPALLKEFSYFDYINTYETDEINADRLYLYLENILFLKNQKEINEEDFRRFKYFVDRTVLNVKTIAYFKKLHEHCDSNGDKFPFESISEYQKENKNKKYGGDQHE